MVTYTTGEDDDHVLPYSNLLGNEATPTIQDMKRIVLLEEQRPPLPKHNSEQVATHKYSILFNASVRKYSNRTL